MGHSEFSIALRNYAGVPVVELIGEINKRTMTTLDDILGKLVQAGHYNIMLNLKRAAWDNLGSLEPLRKAAKLFRAHYGSVDVIVDNDQIDKLRKMAGSLFRYCTSEGQALAFIKRLPAPSAGGVMATSAHLTDS